MRCKRKICTPLAALLLLLTVGCGGGGGSGGAARVSSETTNNAGGWVQLLTPTEAAEFVTTCPEIYLAGEAFISDDHSRCCSGSADDTGVTVTWQNRSTGDAGAAGQSIGVCYFFGTPFLCDHFWWATIPLRDGENRIRVRAEEVAGGTGWGFDSLTIRKPGPSYVAGGSIVTAGGVPLGNQETGIEIVIGGEGFTRTGAPSVDGTFQIGCIPDGSYQLMLNAPLAYVFMPESFELIVNGADVYGLDFTTEAYFVTGKVVYASNASPVPNLNVMISDGIESWVTSTDGQGRYRLAVPNGSYTVTPFFLIANDPSDFFPVGVDVMVNGADIANVDFEFTP